MADQQQVTVTVVRVDALDLGAYAECAKWVGEAHDALEARHLVLLIPPGGPEPDPRETEGGSDAG